MRLCRFQHAGADQAGFYNDDSVIPLSQAAAAHGVELPESDCLLGLLPGGASRDAVTKLQGELTDDEKSSLSIPLADVKLLVPVPSPSKLLLLAGNYSKHIEEGGGKASEREQTFPYVFMKPPQTTLTHPGDPVRIPEVSPDHIDWELELAVIIGRECKGVSEADALNYVAGYTVINDISDRKFKPNPGREERDKDGFFDWLHGKWHDTFCPMGPCVLPADEQADPQTLDVKLCVNGEVEQDGSTAEMIFPVAAVVEFISSFITLMPGDVISTGTTAGVGAAKNKYLKAGDLLEAQIENIGVLRNPVE
ncbi:MAG: fumarylacetoacetate hydrolase family protein [Planctomycetaceae bacterium]|jgi:2,4-didehydro-3-deoxy-L-rhamnonate hydrolase|nr:fumarylacetoacetate hydrolase family protein [Planctomycetaceae bacterium]MBT6154528.1 fumarylacetoacetate hydrolase family protein [Planctomycetaceae bacterium]MBT6486558.1 fumarylacetoacetate hydrolase family protein [Planctomycetaceae bacterium]MBT6496813.1 fumarylacetoacetate hydrolase family protein [Planctomycetaceae bacterium]